jgi:hypothetical protein
MSYAASVGDNVKCTKTISIFEKGKEYRMARDTATSPLYVDSGSGTRFYVNNKHLPFEDQFEPV